MEPGHRAARTMFFFLAAFFSLNLLVLTRFPLVHSDESWLAGLARNMMSSGSLGVTEPFFDLKPRFPHAIKALFHILQMPILLAFGYSAFSARLLSLLFGTGALYLCYRCARETVSSRLSLGSAALIALNGQFLAASHIARQEIILLFGMLLLLLILLKSGGAVGTRTAVFLGIITGLCVGIHPNSLLLALGCGLAMLLPMLAQKRIHWKPLLAYAAVTGGFAALFVGLSFLFDPRFPAHYMAYGESEFDLIVPLTSKCGEFGYYIQKLWYGVSGTYRLPLLKEQLLLWPVLMLSGAVRAVRTRNAKLFAVLGMSLGALLGTIVIGRYNQLSAILWMFPPLLFLPPLLSGIRWRRPAWAALAACFAACSVLSYAPDFSYSYEGYLNNIATYVSPDEKTLGNLNAGFYFENGALLDYRNLSYLKENGLSFAEYVETRGIEVILWSDEMDFIYSHRPAWNIVYGNPRYVEEVEAFLSARCVCVGEFEDPGYAVRIVGEIGKPYKIRVYRVHP
jgi:4-amino-4-deoxy-L-arabinose transferase-like glycosyltransferase